MSYNPYIAVEEQTLKGFTQNILPRLDESEYYSVASSPPPTPPFFKS